MSKKCLRCVYKVFTNNFNVLGIDFWAKYLNISMVASQSVSESVRLRHVELALQLKIRPQEAHRGLVYRGITGQGRSTMIKERRKREKRKGNGGDRRTN